jgi:hypothetical protein
LSNIDNIVTALSGSVNYQSVLGLSAINKGQPKKKQDNFLPHNALFPILTHWGKMLREQRINRRFFIKYQR